MRRLGVAMVVVVGLAGCGDDSAPAASVPAPSAAPPRAPAPQPPATVPAASPASGQPAAQWCTKHLACCESLLRVPGAGGQPRHCFRLHEGVPSPDHEQQCQTALGRIVNSLTARQIDVPADCR